MGLQEIQAQKVLPELFQRIYTYADASRFTHVNQVTIANWYKGYNFDYSGEDNELIHREMDPVIWSNEGKQSRRLSFLDLIDLLYIAKFRELGFSLQHLRQYLKYAKETLNTEHLANHKFFASGKDILLELPDEHKNILSLNKRYQLAFVKVFEPLSNQVKYEDITGYGYVREWSPPEFHGEVVINPKISSGFPILWGTRLQTKNVYDLYRGENNRIKPVANWFGIEPNKVRTAVRYEMSCAG